VSSEGKTKLDTHATNVSSRFVLSQLWLLPLNTIFTQMQDEAFSLKIDTWICEVFLKLRMKCQMRSLWTGRCGGKPRPASSNHSIEWQFVTDILGQPISPSSSVKKSRTENRAQLYLTDMISCFWNFVQCLIFQRSTMFQKPSVFPFSDKEAPNLMDNLDWVILNDWVPHKH
jgi:hypothetical protein